MIENIAAGQPGFTSNAFLVTGARTVLVDVGNDFDAVGVVRQRIEGLDAVILTHTHPDHVGNLPAVTDAFDVDVWGFDPALDRVDHPIADGETVTLGDHEFEAVHTPGHKNDHLCFYAPGPGICFAGDLVFQNGGFGRTDLQEGDHPRLIQSIERLHARVADHITELHTGHGPSVTSNPITDVELALEAAKMSA